MKQIGIIKNVRFGYFEDSGKVGLSFDAYIRESVCAMQFLEGNKALEVIKLYMVSDVNKLNGKSCWVEVDRNFIVFLEPCVI